jgi:hypothetical protein
MPILDEHQRVTRSVRAFRWSDIQVSCHIECWEKRKISSAKERYAKMLAESLILLAVTFIGTYMAI